ncbi:diguanylate cyclase, partial [Lacticaseibacillus rhamnosus]
MWSLPAASAACSAPERELFSYLTSQAAVSVENVDLHETVQRQAVTDELTGLFNHRRFQEVMDAEVERALRYEDEMGLIMLDIDNFTVFDVSNALRERGWQVPAYTFPANRTDLAALRIVVRRGFSHDLADMLVSDIKRQLPHLQMQAAPVHGADSK